MRSFKSVMSQVYRDFNMKFVCQFGFYVQDTTVDKVVDYMYASQDSSSLAMTRILFGLAMLFDIPDERGGASMEKRWGDPETCHFPLFSMLQPMSLQYMAAVYAALVVGAAGIMLGYKYRYAAPLFAISYWYLFLIDKSLWNNHSYLFGLVAILLCCVQANCYWSIDATLDPSIRCQTVPYWNYFVLKYQFFILYFVAGLKKGTSEWLTGYSVQNLSEHWVFDPFKYFMSVRQTDYLVVHWFVFLFDLTIALWLMNKTTRHVAMVFCAMFHLMNSRLFRIGMFPWVCLATLPLFYPFDWPKRLAIYSNYYLKTILASIPSSCNCRKIKFQEAQAEILAKMFNNSRELAGSDLTSLSDYDSDNEKEEVRKTKDGRNKRKLVVFLIGVYAFLQAFLPYSHFITKGYNNWTNGLYGYSWDMMVHTWDSTSISVKIVDNEHNIQVYVDPNAHTLNDRWSRHGDMVLQYAQCLKKNMKKRIWLTDTRRPISDNISIYVDVSCSMNGRFAQRMFDPKADILKAQWSVFESVPFLLPLLDEAANWRRELANIRQRVYEWGTRSDVIFYSEYPGYEQEKFIPNDLGNVTLNILRGNVSYEPKATGNHIVQSFQLNTGDLVDLWSGTFHKIVNIGKQPAFYYYTFLNTSKSAEDEVVKEKLPIMKELGVKLNKMVILGKLLGRYLWPALPLKTCN